MAVSAYARGLFCVSAAGNLAVAAAMAFAQPWFLHQFGFDPIRGANRALVDLAAELIAVFAVGYVWIAIDPARQRSLIWLGAVGKVGAVALALGFAMSDPKLWRFFFLVLGDLVLAVLFLDYLRRHRA